MPRTKRDKVHQKQKQKQTVIVNVGVTRRRRRQKPSASSAPRPPPPSPFMPIPFPVPALRGPEPLVQPQQSLVQQLEQLRALQQLVAPKPPAPAPAPTPAPLPKIVFEEKQEVGSPVLIQPEEAMVTPDEPLVSAKPATPGEKMVVKRPKLAQPIPVPEELKPETSLPSRITRAYLEGLNRDKPKASDPSAPTLLKIASQVGVRLGGTNPPAGIRRRDSISKSDLIDMILEMVGED